MIHAVIFDLDGTLVKTERLKAISYAEAARTLVPTVNKHDVIEAFKDVVGLSRQEVATALMAKFGLEDTARRQMSKFGVDAPWQAYVAIRLRVYDSLIADPDVLCENRWPYTIETIEISREHHCKTGLATMSVRAQALKVLDVLDLRHAFDFVATRDDVVDGKPDPEIYNLVAKHLEAESRECLVIEDSPTGVKAALNAHMRVIAVSTPFTRMHLHEDNLLPAEWIVDHHRRLPSLVESILEDTSSNHPPKPTPHM